MDVYVIAFVLIPAFVAMAVAAGVDDWYGKQMGGGSMMDKEKGTKPYEDCEHCEYKGNHCHVNDKFQRRPRSEGGLGMCIKIGGRGN